MMTGLDIDKILNALRILENEKKENKSIKIIQDYIAPNLSDKIVKIILSHVNYVNTFIWKK